MLSPFPLLENFFDPQKTKDGKPYAFYRFKEIVKERYLISRNINTSYNDLGKITPTERRYLIELISEEITETNKLIEKRKAKNTKNQ